MKPTDSINLTITPRVAKALKDARKRYPLATDSVILEVGLSNLSTVMSDDDSPEEITRMAARAWNVDGYLEDSEEDIYHLGMGKPNNFHR